MTRVLPLPSEPTQRPWSGGSRLKALLWSLEPKRCWKWLRPLKLATRPGVLPVTGLGCATAPTDVASPGALSLRFDTTPASAPLLTGAISGFWTASEVEPLLALLDPPAVPEEWMVRVDPWTPA